MSITHNDPERSGPDGEFPLSIDADTLFAVLDNQSRRYVLYELMKRTDSSTGVDELVDAITIHAPESADPDRQAIATTLRTRHLPKLEKAGIIEYDARTETVQYRGSSPVERWLEFAATIERDP